MSRARMMMIAVALALSTSVMAADWPQFLGPNRDGTLTGQSLPDKLPAQGPKELWSVPVGVGFGGASIAHGKVYLLDREEDSRDVLRCLSLTDGKEMWRSAYDIPGKLPFPGSRSTPTIDEKYIFTCGGFGNVRCYDRATGKVIWEFQLQQKFKSPVPNWGFAQSPLVYKDWVIIAPMSPEAGLAAVTKGKGEVVWKSEPIGGDSYASPRLYKLGGVEQIVFITKAGVCGIDPTNGKKLWQFDGYKNNIPIPSPTQIDDKRLFIIGGYGAGSVMVSVEKNGDAWAVKELWRTKLGSQIHPGYFYKDHLYYNANENDNLKAGGKNAPGLVCSDLNGKVLWQSNNNPGIDRGGMIVVDGKALLLGGETGTLHLIQLNPERYTELSSFPATKGGRGNEHIWGPMAYADGLLVVRDQQVLKCLDLRPAQQAIAR